MLGHFGVLKDIPIFFCSWLISYGELLVGCITFQQHASVSWVRIGSDKGKCISGTDLLRQGRVYLRMDLLKGECISGMDLLRQGRVVGWLVNVPATCVSQRWICSDKRTYRHTEIEVADQTFYITQSQYTDNGLTSPSTDPITPCVWQGSHWSANFYVTGMTWPGKIPVQAGIKPLGVQGRETIPGDVNRNDSVSFDKLSDFYDPDFFQLTIM